MQEWEEVDRGLRPSMAGEGEGRVEGHESGDES